MIDYHPEYTKGVEDAKTMYRRMTKNPSLYSQTLPPHAISSILWTRTAAHNGVVGGLDCDSVLDLKASLPRVKNVIAEWCNTYGNVGEKDLVLEYMMQNPRYIITKPRKWSLSGL